MNEIRALLDHNFPQFEPALLDELAASGVVKTFAEGEELIRTGQYIRSTMLVVDGLIKLYREGEEGGEYFIYYIEPGNACALSMVCASRQLTSEVMARAMKPSTVILVPIGLMDELMFRYKSWHFFVLETYRARFEELLAVVDAIAFRNMDERLLFYFRNQSKVLGTKTLALTHQQIADDLNSSREVVSRLLKKLEQHGFVQLHRNQIELTDLFPFD